MKEKHLQYFNKKILPKFNDSRCIPKKYKKEHEIFINYCIEHAKELAIGTPAQLKIFEANIPQEARKLFQKDPIIKKDGKAKRYYKYLESIFGYKEFTNQSYTSKQLLTMDNFIKQGDLWLNQWTPYHLVMMSNLRVCPYCNRQYITPLYKQSKKESIRVRADLDHFFPKNRYPYFSMSLYNLVPSCKFCNSSLKHTKEFNMQDINPYEESFGDYFSFRVETDSSGEVHVMIDKTYDSRVEHYLEYFQIEEQYKYHRNQATDIVLKSKIYTDEYIDELWDSRESLFTSIFGSKNELRKLLIGCNSDKSQINNEILSKFKRDIGVQLGLIKDTTMKQRKFKGINRELLNELKEKLR